MNIKRFFIKIEGIVQGVGFRPFVYNIAISNNLNGWVINSSQGVFIDIEGPFDCIERFIKQLNSNPPPLSKIKKINIIQKSPCNYNGFIINDSIVDENKTTLISPDIATCDQCKAEILDPNNKRYFYPFTNCTCCGPRYSIIKKIPYDRQNTTMEKFKLCPECEDEYKNPLNRRFHAEANCCSNCGPHIYLADNNGLQLPIHFIEAEDFTNNSNFNKKIIYWTQKKLKKGNIFGIKGLTGFHLVCDGENNDAINLLRKRKNRPHKPFAIMIKDINTVKKYCKVNSIEEKLLTSRKKPIVLLEKLKECELSEALAPNQNKIGVMLPYTPLHELLFLNDINILVMTSGNNQGFPLEHTNESAIKNLGHLVDYFLMHNRDIYIPIDDSVSKVVLGEVRVLRRARGYAPEPLTFDQGKSILGCGANMKNTTSIFKDNFLFLSPHNGDLKNLETLNHFSNNINHYNNIFSFSPEYLALDMHPGYYTTEYAKSSKAEVIQVQHHHAHIVSCMVENKLSNKVIGLAFDGTGYGLDNNIWGGEFLICDYKEFKRAAHLDYVLMPGGEKSILEPWRIGVAHLYKSLPKSSTLISELYGEKSKIILTAIDKNLNCIKTSSMGRFFDAISSIIDVCHEVTYEGQAAIELESLINSNDDTCYKYKILDKNNELLINTIEIINSIVKDKRNNVPKNIISQRFHNTIISFSTEICKTLRYLYKINDVVLSGGVFQNNYLLIGLTNALKRADFNVYSHCQFPTNDSGISLGQVVIANENLKNNLK